MRIVEKQCFEGCKRLPRDRSQMRRVKNCYFEFPNCVSVTLSHDSNTAFLTLSMLDGMRKICVPAKGLYDDKDSRKWTLNCLTFP